MKTKVRKHLRKTKRKVSVVRHHRRSSMKRYTTESGRFEKMEPIEGGKQSRFGGCERAMIARGYSKESAKKICAYIARRKK